jgi:hypothetical protein
MTIMTTKEEIHLAVEKMAEENLAELLEMIRAFLASKNGAKRPGVLSRLQRIKIDAPPDFASNLELYMSGEKRVD